MPRPTGRRARVVAAALRVWTAGARPDAAALRLEVREPGTWEHAATVNVGDDQAERLLALLRRDVADRTPRACTPDQAAAAVHDRLVALLAADRRTISRAELVDVARRCGQSTQWLAGHVLHLLDAGHLRVRWWRPRSYRITLPPAWAVRPGITARSPQ